MGGRQQAVSCMAQKLGQHPRSVGVLQFEMLDLPRVWSDGDSSRCEGVQALSNAHPLCGPRLQCARASALEALVSPRNLYTDHPALFPCRSSQGARQNTRSTNHYGSLGGAGLIWGVCQCLRLRNSEMN